MSKREEILTTAAADKMLGMISPIYDESYVGLWIMEVIGREYQRLADVVSELPEQMQPETATWLLEFWEQRYGITPPEGSTTERRRELLLAKIRLRDVSNEAGLEEALSQFADVPVRIDGHIGDYTFGVYVEAISHPNMAAIAAQINRLKPAHMSYELSTEQIARAEVFSANIVTHFIACQISQAP